MLNGNLIAGVPVNFCIWSVVLAANGLNNIEQSARIFSFLTAGVCSIVYTIILIKKLNKKDD